MRPQRVRRGKACPPAGRDGQRRGRSGPPIRTATTSTDSFVAIGRRGKPRFLAVRHEDARIFALQIRTYRVAALRDDLGRPGILLEINRGGKVPHASVKEALRLLCQQVMPRVK